MEVQISLVGRRGLADEIIANPERHPRGRLSAGELLPPTREMARRLSVSRSTVSTAYDRLIGEGFAIGKVGSGTRGPRMSLGRRPFDGRNAHPFAPRAVWEHVRPADRHLASGRVRLPDGIPDASLFPYQSWRRLMNCAFRPMAIGDGTYGHPGGHPALREAIARHVGTARENQADPQDVIVTTGTQQAVDLIARVLVAPGERVAVEGPGYGPPRRLFRTSGPAGQRRASR